MSEFQPAPSKVLNDKAETLAALANPDWMNQGGLNKFRVKSQWLCDELNAYEKQEGYAYNAQFLRYIEKLEGIGPYDENGSPLSILIYNAQGYRRSDALRAKGFEPGTEAMLIDAFHSGRKLELYNDSIFGGSSINVLTVKSVSGKLYAMQPRMRVRAVNIIGKPVRLASGDKQLGSALTRKGILHVTT